MSVLWVQHIKADCRTRFASLIDVSDIHAKTNDDRDVHFLTRALAAFAIAALARIDDQEAADAITDEPLDDGIDGFYYSASERVCYIVQSKWSNNGSGSIDVGSVLKFTQGIEHIVNSELTRLGPKLRKKQNAIAQLLADSSARFVLVIAYTGRASLSNEAMVPLNALLEQLNEDEDMVAIQLLRQQELHKIVEQRALGELVDINILLKEVGKIEKPKAFYGQLDVADIAAWINFGDKLYARNIRAFKGSTDVNEAIVNTLKSAPENFVYFNNGITITCSQLRQTPHGLGGKASRMFECKGVNVVNGAQTVGSIMSFLSANNNESSAKVMVRIISLESCTPDFSSEITRAVNTQNRIERRDFASLDPSQARLKSDLSLSFNQDYVFRTGEAPPEPENGLTLDEASVALACCNTDIALALLAKREVGKLYEDIHSAPYSILFNGSTSALVVWRAVQVLRIVDGALKEFQASAEGKAKLVAIHFNRMILHLTFRAIGPLDGPEEQWPGVRDQVEAITSELVLKITNAIEALYPVAYIGSLFKNATKSKQIVATVIKPAETQQTGVLFE